MRRVLQRYTTSTQSVPDSNGHAGSIFPNKGRTFAEFVGEATKGRGEPRKTRICQ